MIRYLADLPKGKMILWCYLIWYFVTVFYYFDSAFQIWLNSVGISVIIGVALILSVSNGKAQRPDKWQVFRLFAMPFCVSSFSSLIKGKGFILFIPPNPNELFMAVILCAGFIALVLGIKLSKSRAAALADKS